MNNDVIKNRFLAKVARQNYYGFLQQPNIVGLAFGKKNVHKKDTGEHALVVFVMKKVPRAFLPPSHIIPKKVYIGNDCLLVDVVETGPLYPFDFTARERPAPSGISIGHFNITAGTLGALVVDRTDESLCILSNNHVLADVNAGNAGDAILQPGAADGGVVGADTIATLKRFQMLNPTGNVIDAAIAQVTNRADVVNSYKNNLMPVASPNHPAVGLLFAGGCNQTIMNPIDQVLSLLNIQFPAGGGSTVAADLDMHVEKVGRTTEYTSSTITAIDATVQVNYGTPSVPDLKEFDHQITTAWMSNPGDSGSLICRGGEGGNVDNCSGCGSTQAARSILDRDMTMDVAAEKVFRNNYFSNTLTGRYLLDTYFNNEDQIVQRARKVSSDKEDVQYLQYLYDKYSATARSAIVNPMSSQERLTGEHLAEAKQALGRMGKHLQPDEQDGVNKLFEIAQRFEGKPAEEILKMLDDKKIYNEVVKIVSNVSSLKKKDC